MDNPATLVTPKYQEFVYKMAAGEEINVTSVGDFFACLDATDDFKIAFSGGSKTVFKAGIKYRPGFEIGSVQLLNHNASEITVTIAIGKGDIDDNRLTVSGSINSRSEVADDATDSALVTVEDGDNDQVLAANSLRREAIIANIGTDLVYIVFDSSTTVKGIPLASGATWILETTAAIRIYNPSGNDVDILPTEIGFSS